MKKKLAFVLSILMLLTILGGCSAAPAAPAVAPAAAPSAATSEEAPAESAEAAEAEEPFTWPDGKSITMIIPFNAGGDTDFNGRLIAQKLNEKLGINIVCQNMAGNAGAIGAQEVLDSDPDGLTMLFFHTAILTNEASHQADFGFDDFETCCICAQGILASGAYYMRTDNPYGITDFESLVAYTKEHPGEITMGSQVGGTSHLAALLMQSAGVDATLVDFSDATARLAALLGGQLDICTLTDKAAKEYVEDGTFFPVGYIAAEQNPLLPEIPCLADRGMDFPVGMYYGIWFPKGTDERIVSYISDAVGEIVNSDEDYQKTIAETYFQSPYFAGGEEAVSVLNGAREIVMGFEEEMSAGNG